MDIGIAREGRGGLRKGTGGDKATPSTGNGHVGDVLADK